MSRRIESVSTAKVSPPSQNDDLGETHCTLETQAALALPLSEGLVIVKEILSDFQPFEVANTENWYNFMLKITEIVSLSLLPLSTLLYLVVSKLPPASRHFWLLMLNMDLSWPQITERVWSRILSDREFDRLIDTKVKRFQFPRDTPHDLVCSVRNAIQVLALHYSKSQTVRLIIQGLNPITKSAIMFSNEPKTFEELDSVFTQASKQLMDGAEDAKIFHGSSQNMSFAVSPSVSSDDSISRRCSYCHTLVTKLVSVVKYDVPPLNQQSV
jgi:hypothetical protein